MKKVLHAFPLERVDFPWPGFLVTFMLLFFLGGQNLWAQKYYTWIGGTSSVWELDANWSSTPPGGYPSTSADGAYISSGTYYPICSSTSITCGDLIIDAGGQFDITTTGNVTCVNLNIYAGGQLNVTTSGTVACTYLLIDDGASVIENGQLTYSDHADIKLAINSTEYSPPPSPPNAIARWHLFITPLVNPVQATASSTFYFAFVDRWDEPTTLWARLQTDDYVNPGYGHEIQFYDYVTHVLTFTATPTNQMQSGDQQYTLSKVGATGSFGPGWNLIGNKFPCSIDLSTAWTYTSGEIGAAVYVWNADNANYISYSLLSSNLIAPMQGFWIWAHVNGANLTIPETSKAHGGTFLKNQMTVSNNLLLKVEGNGHWDQTQIRFNPLATPGFDLEYDAFKLAGFPAVPQIFSLLPDESASINTLPSIEDNPEVPLGFTVGADTTYSITTSGIESFDLSVPLRLDDLKTGYSHDLRLGPYTFSAAPGDAVHRFNLRFKSGVGIGEKKNNAVTIYSSANYVYVNNPLNLTGTTQVYDLTGRLLVESPLTGNLLNRYAVEATTSCLIVKVITENGIATGKIFVNL